jgi:oxygen-dependent protoporphyrinogen oxidase
VDTLNTTTPANAVVLATPAPVTGALLDDYHAAFEELRGVESAGAAMVTFSLARNDVTLPERGTGVLVPLGTAWQGPGSMMVTAVTFLDRKWLRLVHDDDVLLRAHVGRSDDARWLEMSDDELTQRVRDELNVLLGPLGTPRATLVQRWPNGLPQYVLGHAQKVQRARDAASALSLALAGNAYDGVGVPASIGSGRSAAHDVLTLLQQP